MITFLIILTMLAIAAVYFAYRLHKPSDMPHQPWLPPHSHKRSIR